MEGGREGEREGGRERGREGEGGREGRRDSVEWPKAHYPVTIPVANHLVEICIRTSNTTEAEMMDVLIHACTYD